MKNINNKYNKYGTTINTNNLNNFTDDNWIKNDFYFNIHEILINMSMEQWSKYIYPRLY